MLYKATGINLKSMPLGEADRLVTILTPEYGLITAVAPGARKPKSSLRGRIEPFVVNNLLIVKGKSLDKIIQAETLQSYPGLGKELGKLAASQYLAEIVLGLGLSEQPQGELFTLFKEHLRRLETLSLSQNPEIAAAPLLGYLSQGFYHLLAVGGIAPQVQRCGISGEAIAPNLDDRTWQIGFSFDAGGIITLTKPPSEGKNSPSSHPPEQVPSPHLHGRLNGLELSLLQNLPRSDVLEPVWLGANLAPAWLKVERLLRSYWQYQVNKPVRSATLIDSLYTPKA